MKPVVVEGGYNLPEGTEVAVEKAEEAKRRAGTPTKDAVRKVAKTASR